MLNELICASNGFARELLEETDRQLAGLPCQVKIDHLHQDGNTFDVSFYAPDLAAEVTVGDVVYGGLSLWHDPVGATEAGIRIFRVACCNGAMMDVAEGHRTEFKSATPPRTWRKSLARTIRRSFDGGSVDEEARRFRVTVNEILTTPYEFLLHLRAQDLITEDDQIEIQRAFDREGDYTLYGFFNAVTSIAHLRRDQDLRDRAKNLERLGGAIASGDQQPPIGVPVW